MKNNDIRVGDLVYAPTKDNDGKLFKVMEILSGSCELLHDGETFNMPINSVFLKTDTNISALDTLYPKIRFDGYLYYYKNNAMDKLLEHKKQKNILAMVYYNDRYVYVSIVKKVDDYYIDTFNSRWVEVVPVIIDDNFNFSETRVINND